MSLGVATIDWYADGFEARLEGSPPLGNAPAIAALLGALGGMTAAATFLMTNGRTTPDWAWQWVMAAIGISLLVVIAGGLVTAVSRERRPVHLVEVDAHRLRVRTGAGKLVLDVLLEEVTGIDVTLGNLEIGHPSGVFRIDASSQIPESVEDVEKALEAAVASRRIPETEADRERRKQALAALERLRASS